MNREKSDVVLMKNPQDAGSRLARILALANEEWDEAWLQKLLFNHPELLPISEFDPQFGELIPLACEVAVPNGSIDNLYITATGQLVIVETKLWKNPEAHREVIGQILQYAKAVSAWDYAQLDLAVSSALKKEESGTLARLVTPAIRRQGIDLPAFQESLLRSLRAGRFLLLIVGDRISPNVVFLSGMVHRAPGMEFSLGLVELRMYALQNNRDWPLVVVPDVVGRTVEETRAIVRVEHDAPRPIITVPDPAKEKGARGKVTLETLAAQLPPPLKKRFEETVRHWQTKAYPISFGRVGVAFHVPIKSKTFSVFEVYPHLVSGLTRKRVGSILSAQHFADYMKQVKQAPTVFQRLNAGKPYASLKSLPSAEFDVLLQANVDLADAIAQPLGEY